MDGAIKARWLYALCLSAWVSVSVCQPRELMLDRHMADVMEPSVLRPVPDVTFTARQLSDAAMAEQPRIAAAVDAMASVDQRAFQSGIDKVSVSREEHAGPHLLTTSAALEIEQAGRAFLESATGTSDRLSIPVASRGMAFEGASIVPILPPRLRCPYDPSTWPRCDRSSPYRTPDGSCNNLDNPLWGRAQTPFERFERPDYDDGISSPRTRSSSGGVLPNARLISRQFHQNQINIMPDLNNLAMEYGQFVSHDIQFNALSRGYGGSRLDCCAMPNRHNCFPIDIPAGDPFFPANRTCINMVRALPTPNLDCRIGVRQQLNQNTHFLDGSQVYGSDKTTADSLRTFRDGLMKTSGSDEKLPTETGNNAGCIVSNPAFACFKAGDVRVNQQPGLMSVQTIFMREHNRLARRLAQDVPAWRGDDEKLYQEARRIVIAEMQHITYNEYLQEILGETTMNRWGLKPQTSGYFNGYNSREKPMIRNGFSTAAFRFGHSMIYHRMPSHNGHVTTTNNLLKDVFLKPDLIYTRGVNEVARGLTRSPSESVDKYVTEQVTRHLFERQPGFGGDLAAINIQRGRDHGIPNYQTWRDFCSLPGRYSHRPDIQRQLRGLYRSDFDLDLFTAGVSETPIPDAKVGPTFACIIGRQFSSMKTGDRFYYENSGTTSFTQRQLGEIRKATLANVICRNTDINNIQRRALSNILNGNPLVNCRSIPDIDLSAWRGAGCTPVDGGWSAWQQTPCFGQWRLRYRLCNNPRPNECGRPCSAPYEMRVQFCGFRFPDFPFRQDRPMRAGMSFQRAASVDRASTSAITGQIEQALSGMISPGENVDAGVLERALSSVTGNSVGPRGLSRL